MDSQAGQPWWRHEHILSLEARALVKSLERIAECRRGLHIHQLLLCGNMSVVLASDRLHTKTHDLIRHIRRFTSYLLGRDIDASVRWIPCKFHSSDAPSHLHDLHYETSAHLTDKIPQPPQAFHLMHPRNACSRVRDRGLRRGDYT